jgi:hypothetical protein
MDIDTDVSPAVITAALTDFTAERPRIWPGIDPTQYQVYEIGDHWAEIREGTSASIWARERYDWSKPGNVTWTVQESQLFTPGDYVSADITPRGTGSHVDIHWQRRGRNLNGKLAVALIVLTRGWLVKRSMMKGLKTMQDRTGVPAEG